MMNQTEPRPWSQWGAYFAPTPERPLTLGGLGTFTSTRSLLAAIRKAYPTVEFKSIRYMSYLTPCIEVKYRHMEVSQ